MSDTQIYNRLSEEILDQFLDDLKNYQEVPSGEFQIIIGCKSRGIVNVTSEGSCKDSECSNCRQFDKYMLNQTT